MSKGGMDAAQGVLRSPPVKDSLQRFSLTLMVNHACNLRCTYCYTGAKFSSPMNWTIGVVAIDRALRSLGPGGRLGLGFFGGEPLLEAGRILDWMEHARTQAMAGGTQVRFSMTTNGTLVPPQAWRVMTAPDLDLTVSCDGPPKTHDLHRRDAQGAGSAQRVEETLRRLVEAGIPFRINAVVRPDTLEQIPLGLIYLHEIGVRHIDLSLDLWTTWSAADGRRLEQAIDRMADLWRQWLPEFSLNWFDAKVAALARLPMSEGFTPCGFGDGEVAVAPSGRLYPCERLIGEDRPDQPHRLPGHVLDGRDTLGTPPPAWERCSTCSSCRLADACDTYCRCSNFVRTGDVNRPDGLLCLLNKAIARSAGRVLGRPGAMAQHQPNEPEPTKDLLCPMKT